jgi:hypothetical protein
MAYLSPSQWSCDEEIGNAYRIDAFEEEEARLDYKQASCHSILFKSFLCANRRQPAANNSLAHHHIDRASRR